MCRLPSGVPTSRRPAQRPAPSQRGPAARYLGDNQAALLISPSPTTNQPQLTNPVASPPQFRMKTGTLLLPTDDNLFDLCAYVRRPERYFLLLPTDQERCAPVVTVGVEVAFGVFWHAPSKQDIRREGGWGCMCRLPSGVPTSRHPSARQRGPPGGPVPRR
jgi:hypothetical protein